MPPAPKPIFGNVNGYGDVDFANADLNTVNGQIHYLLFSYNAPSGGNYNPKFKSNNLGFIDLTRLPLDYIDLYSIFLNDPQQTDVGNFLKIDYPIWRPGRDEITFLYNRRGNPPAMQKADPRTPPPQGVWERQNKFYPLYGQEYYNTYDIGRLSFDQQSEGSYSFFIETSIWADPNAASGSGVNFRPSWQPVANSSNLVASYSKDGGFSYNIALFGNIGDDTRTNDTFDPLTTNGSSYLPSWGTVTPVDVRARLQVSPRYLEPGPKSYYYLSGGGFQPNEQVQLVDETDGGDTVLRTVQADPDGVVPPTRFILDAPTSKAHYFVARGTAIVPELGAIKTSNQDVLVPLAHGGVYLPIILR